MGESQQRPGARAVVLRSLRFFVGEPEGGLGLLHPAGVPVDRPEADGGDGDADPVPRGGGGRPGLFEELHRLRRVSEPLLPVRQVVERDAEFRGASHGSSQGKGSLVEPTRALDVAGRPVCVTRVVQGPLQADRIPGAFPTRQRLVEEGTRTLHLPERLVQQPEVFLRFPDSGQVACLPREGQGLFVCLEGACVVAQRRVGATDALPRRPEAAQIARLALERERSIVQPERTVVFAQVGVETPKPLSVAPSDASSFVCSKIPAARS